jgi:hypothetical protein
MPVLFRTQQGRTLRNDELTIDDVASAVAEGVVVCGYEFGRDLEWHVNASHIVEWCDGAPIGANRGREE